MGLSRAGLYAELGLLSVVEPILQTAYEREAYREWKDGSGDSPHGSKWSTSFHASQAPGTNELACGRQAVYGLMDLPDPAPREPRVSAMFAVGLDLEHNWIRKFAQEGVLLSNDVTAADDFQTGFVDEEHWLTGASDAIILPAFWRKGHPVEVKTTSHEKVLKMRADPNDTPYSHAKYLRQIKTYTGFAHELPFAPTVTVCSESWALTSEVGNRHWCPIHQSLFCDVQIIELDPPDDGSLVYSSREEPLTTASYYVAYDAEHMRATREKLAEWKSYYLRGELPPHVRGNGKPRWSEDPCRFCDRKATACRPDEKEGVTRLADSHAIKAAKKIRPAYDYEASRREVLFRWGAEDLSPEAVPA